MSPDLDFDSEILSHASALSLHLENLVTSDMLAL